MNSFIITANSWYTKIDKLMLWRGSWTKYECKTPNLFLRVVYDQLLITAETKILESFNMHLKIKGIYKNDVIILIINNNNEIRKIKFQLISNIAQCLEILGRHFPVVSHHLKQSNQIITSKYRNINEVLKFAVERKGTDGQPNIPTNFEKLVKLCLLDPSFPHLVTETEKILTKEIHQT